MSRPSRPPIAVSTERLPTVLLGAAMLLSAAIIYHHGRDTTFYFDDWGWFLDRRPWREDVLFEPYNGHLSAVPILVYKVLFELVGLEHYGVYRALLVAVHLLCAGLLFVLLRRRIGAPAALVLVLPILLLGSAWHDLLVPFQLSFLISIAAGLGAWLGLERDSRGGDLAAALLLVVSLGSSSLGAVFAVAVVVELLARRRTLARVWVGALPILIYAAWYVDRRDSPQGSRAANGPLSELLPDNLPATPAFAADAAGGALSGMLGVGGEWSRPLLALGAVLVVWRVLRVAVISPRLVSLLAAAATYWGVLGIFRVGRYSPTESRYLYLGAVLVVLVAAELAAGAPLGRRALAVAAVVVLGALVGNYGALRAGGESLRAWSEAVGSRFGAVELVASWVNPELVPDPERLPQVRAGVYLETVAELGSPALAPTEIAALDEGHRQTADAILLRTIPVRREPGGVPGGRTPLVTGVEGGVVTVRSPCLEIAPSGGTATLEAVVPPSGVLVESRGAPVEYRVRGFASSFPPAPLDSVQAGGRATVKPPRLSGLKWTMRIASSGPAALCGVSARG